MTPSPAWSLRPARAADAPTIRALVRGERLDPTQLRWQQFLVAEAAGTIVGVGQLRRYGAVQELGSLVVVPPWRGQHVGQALVRALVAQRSGPLYLECASARAPYYERLGFRRLPWYRVPWPLKAKFALSFLFGKLAGGVTAMRYERAPSAEESGEEQPA